GLARRDRPTRHFISTVQYREGIRSPTGTANLSGWTPAYSCRIGARTGGWRIYLLADWQLCRRKRSLPAGHVLLSNLQGPWLAITQQGHLAFRARIALQRSFFW